MRKLWKYSLFYILVLIIVLAGCSSSNGGSESSTNAEKPVSKNKNQDTLAIGLDDDPPQLDPHRSSAAVDRQVFQSLYNTLVDLNEDLEIVPELANKWQVSEDSKTYTFKLQKGVTFHDGTPFNAKAVKFNFERMLNPELASPRKSEINLVTEVIAVDEYTVKVKLRKPYAPFLSVLTDRAGMMVSPTAVKEKGKGFSNNPVGTGPYKFVERVQQDHIKLALFDDYWREKPAIKNVVYKPYPDGNTRVTNLISGNLDIVNQIPFKDLDKVKNSSNLNISVKDGLGFQGLMLNTDKKPFSNKKVRQAINIAIDRKAIAEVVYHDGVTPAVSPFPPSSWAHPEDMEVPEANIGEAKKLIAESGLNNVNFTLKITPKPEEKQIGQMLQSMLGQIGIKVEIEMVEFGTLLEEMRNHEYDALRIGWSGRVDPDGNTFTWFSTDGSLNEMSYSNSQVDELLIKARATSDREKRKELYSKVSHILWEEVPYVFIFHEKNIKPMKNYVEGYNHVPDGMIRTETISFK
ncbi:ABC transporter substrate-binding protein [Virgibacillus siamensis]|uniref:ABC transporter substrate-binding protein n=1 Tax=Virgibacillus siamensis TaxID=480071 RepID=UPI0009854D10|nr:ABC transporter substrate-binding protein [Virgibacillus siamensis]